MMKRKRPFGIILGCSILGALIFSGCPGVGPGTGSGGTDSGTVYTVTLPAASADGTVTASKTIASKGDSITLTSNPASGKKLTAWAWNGKALPVTASTAVFTMPAANVTVTAAFGALAADEYQIVTGSYTGGKVTASPAYGKVGDTITLTVTANKGYLFKAGSLKAGGSTVAVTNGTGTFTLSDANGTIDAEFVQIPYTITKSGVQHGKIAILDLDNNWNDYYSANPVELTTATSGKRVYVKVVADEGYIVGGITVTGASGSVEVDTYWQNELYDFRMPAENVIISATFVTPITVSGTIDLQVTGISDFNVYIRLYTDDKYHNYVANLNLSPNGSDWSNAAWSVELPSAAANQNYYALIGVGGNEGEIAKELGLFFTAGNQNVTVPKKTITIAAVAISGTLNVTVNGTAFIPDGNRKEMYLSAYSDSSYTNQVGYMWLDTSGSISWSMAILDSSKVYFRVALFDYDNDFHLEYKIGEKTVSSSPITLTAAITTKTISGTFTPLPGGDDWWIELLFASAAPSNNITSMDALYDFLNTIEQYGDAYVKDDGTWQASVLGTVNNAYVLLAIGEEYEDGSYNYAYYISKNKVTLTGSASIAFNLSDFRLLYGESSDDRAAARSAADTAPVKPDFKKFSERRR
jgi:hypothetical protein